MNEDQKTVPFSQEYLPLSSLEQMGEEEFWSYAQRLAKLTPTEVQTEEFLECAILQSRCLIPLSGLCEVILQHQRFTLLPGSPEWLAGITAWRSETIAVINLAAYLTGQIFPITSEATLLVVRHHSPPLGLVVPTIGMTLTVPPERIQSASFPASIQSTPFTRSNVFQGEYAGAYLLNLPALLTDVLGQIEMAAQHG